MTKTVPTGILYGLGIGPGDPGLVTVKAHSILTRVPVIAYPATLEGESMARKIVAPHLDDAANLERIEIAIPIPMVEERDPGREAYDAAAQEIAPHLNAGRDVAVLCLGDPFLYG
ncbi:MAG: precorrin-2 C(20)-methyltransferase, partial [Rhodospirillaceae bacterium]|nr:precorrin-2 C(20)-methyltransferase [Rhodospirillaceae bacterium]